MIYGCHRHLSLSPHSLTYSGLALDVLLSMYQVAHHRGMASDSDGMNLTLPELEKYMVMIMMTLWRSYLVDLCNKLLWPAAMDAVPQRVNF